MLTTTNPPIDIDFRSSVHCSDDLGERGRGRHGAVELPPTMIRDDDPRRPRFDARKRVVAPEHSLHDDGERRAFDEPGQIFEGERVVEERVRVFGLAVALQKGPAIARVPAPVALSRHVDGDHERSVSLVGAALNRVQRAGAIAHHVDLKPGGNGALYAGYVLRGARAEEPHTEEGFRRGGGARRRDGPIGMGAMLHRHRRDRDRRRHPGAEDGRRGIDRANVAQNTRTQMIVAPGRLVLAQRLFVFGSAGDVVIEGFVDLRASLVLQVGQIHPDQRPSRRIK